MNHLIEKLYFKSPIFVQNLLTTLYGYRLFYERYLGNHNRYLSELLKSQWLSQSEMEALNEKNFRSILEHAFETVPFYISLKNKGIIDSKRIKGIADIEKLPMISKEMIREKPELFVSKKYNKNRLLAINTSGTTGKTLKIYVDIDSRRRAYSFFSRLKTWAGLQLRDKSVTFAGRVIIPPDASAPPFWRANHSMNNYLFSSYHLTEKNIKHYIDGLKDIQPAYIDSYPSAIYTLAKYMSENGIDDINPKAIITSSETLFEHQRKVIENAFKTQIFDQYGSAEQVVFCSQCETGSYHNHPEFGFIEFINSDGARAKVGEQAKMICTGFTNMAMPLIRYDIGDTGVLSDKKCQCGRNFPVLENIVGRTDDVFTMRDGRKVGRLDPVFKGLRSIKEAQIIQEDLDNVTLKIVPGENYISGEEQNIVLELKKRLGGAINIHTMTVTQIERTSSGKFRAVISKVRE